MLYSIERHFLMQQFPPVNEVRPYGVVDLTDQSTMLLVLEELGIAHLQDEWLRTHTPEAPDAAQAAEQHKEFFEDLCAILEGKAGPDRVEPNGWAGVRFAEHLRAAMPEVLARALAEAGKESDPSRASDHDVVAAALQAFEASLSRLSLHQEKIKTEGAQADPAEYIQLMIGWSGVFSGKAESLKLSDLYMPYL